MSLSKFSVATGYDQYGRQDDGNRAAYQVQVKSPLVDAVKRRLPTCQKIRCREVRGKIPAILTENRRQSPNKKKARQPEDECRQPGRPAARAFIRLVSEHSSDFNRLRVAVKLVELFAIVSCLP